MADCLTLGLARLWDIIVIIPESLIKPEQLKGLIKFGIMQGRDKKKKKIMIEETVCVGVDITKNTLDLAASNSKEALQFNNNP